MPRSAFRFKMGGEADVAGEGSRIGPWRLCVRREMLARRRSRRRVERLRWERVM